MLNPHAPAEGSLVSTVTNPKFIIEGGRPLSGSVTISGSKNASLYALAACLLTGDEVTLENVPEIEDVRVMSLILLALGASVQNDGAGVWRVRAAEMTRLDAPNELVVNQRASFLVMGPLLGRFGEAACCSPGGDVIGSRPLDVHIEGFQALGAAVTRRGDQYLARCLSPNGKLSASRIFLDYPSATGTMNVIFAAVLAAGETTIINAACEPEIVDIAEMLNSMGARIDGAGGNVIRVTGVDSLRGGRHRIIPDRLEAGLFALASGITRGSVRVEGARADHLEALLAKMEQAGVAVERDADGLSVHGEGRVYHNVQAQAVPYPGLATDLHPPLAAFLTQCPGVSVIHERVYENRLLYVGELRKMGADVITAGQTALITGPTRLYGTAVRAVDIRAGGSLVLAALAAEGRSEIHDTHHLDRGHQDLVAKLQSLGASVAVD